MGNDSPNTKLTKPAEAAEELAKKLNDEAKQASAYWAGYLSGYTAGWDEAVTKSLASIVDIYGAQLGQNDLPDWESDWNLVGADLQIALESISSRPDIAAALAVHQPELAGLLESDAPDATPEGEPKGEPAGVEAK